MTNQKYKKIPNNAKCVFKGVMHDVYQWQQELFDGSFTTFEVLKRLDNVDVIATTRDKKVLVNFEEQPNRSPKICTPCGASEEGEDLLEAAKRELAEETGFISENWSEWIYVDVLKYGKLEWNCKYFIAKNCEQKQAPNVDGGEKIETKLFAFEEFLKITQEERFSQHEIKDEVAKILNSKNVQEEKEKFKALIFGEN